MIYDEAVIPVPEDGSMPPWPEDFDSMTPEEQDFIRVHHRYACRHRAYRQLVIDKDVKRRHSWLLPHFIQLAHLAPAVTRCISDGPTKLRRLLMGIQRRWDDIQERVASAAVTQPCPIDFTPEEVEMYTAEEDRRLEYQTHVDLLCLELPCAPDGEVMPEQYETAKALMEQRRSEWDEAEMKGPFPFSEGMIPRG